MDKSFCFECGYHTSFYDLYVLGSEISICITCFFKLVNLEPKQATHYIVNLPIYATRINNSTGDISHYNYDICSAFIENNEIKQGSYGQYNFNDIQSPIMAKILYNFETLKCDICEKKKYLAYKTEWNKVVCAYCVRICSFCDFYTAPFCKDPNHKADEKYLSTMKEVINSYLISNLTNIVLSYIFI